MALNLAWDALINAGSGLVLVLFGAWLLRLRPRSRGTAALGAFAACFGAIFVADNLVAPGDPFWAQPFALALVVAVELGAVAALAMVLLWLPTPLARTELGLLPLPLLAGALHMATRISGLLLEPPGAGPAAREALGAAEPVAFLVAASFGVVRGAAMFGLVLLPLRFRAARLPAHRAQLALMAAALALMGGTSVGTSLLAPASGAYEVGPGAAGYDAIPGAAAAAEGAVGAGLLVLAALLWLRNAAAGRGAEARTARHLAWFVLGVPLASMAMVVALRAGSTEGVGGPQFGIARTLAVLLLAYAILRHRLLGIDVRLKWTVKQSTVAAAFIGVFFVVSESAATFFSGGLGPYLGIAAAGLLVFALAPLQRAAERLASAAMPGVRSVGEMSAEERMALYARQVRAAWADGALSRDERETLEHLRLGLGLSVEEAHRAEREAAGRG